MKSVFCTLIITGCLGCTRLLSPADPSVITSGRYTVDHRGSVHMDVNLTGGGVDTVYHIDTTVISAVMLYNGFLVLPRNILGDTISRVWLQWGEGGPWIPYDLPDSLNQ